MILMNKRGKFNSVPRRIEFPEFIHELISGIRMPPYHLKYLKPLLFPNDSHALSRETNGRNLN